MGRDSGTIIDSVGEGMLWSRERNPSVSLFRNFGFHPVCLRAFVWTGKFCLGGGELTLLLDCSPVSGEKTSPSVQKESVRYQVYDLLKMNGKDMGISNAPRRSKLEELLRGFLSICISVYTLGENTGVNWRASSGIEGKRVEDSC